jgi:hypothetical protein
MPERDEYIPSVPCWLDAGEPDRQAAVDLYGGLFGWEFRDVMPASAEGSYIIAWHETREPAHKPQRRGELAGAKDPYAASASGA